MCFDGICLAGLFLLWAGIFKPKFFWRSSQVMSIRSRMGDLKAQLFYVGLGALMLGILVAFYGPLFVGGKLLYAAIFGAIAFGIFQAFVWYRNRNFKPSRKVVKLQNQRQQLSRLLRL